VNRQARRWAAAAALLLLVAGGALAFGQASGTFAIFTAETKNPNAVFQGSWIPPIASTTSSLVTSGSFNQVQLSWTPGAIPSSGNPITGYSLEYADGLSGASANCQSYGPSSTPAGSPTSVTGTNISDWWCYRIHATSATVWTSQTVAFTPRRLFSPINTVVFSEHGGTAGFIEQLDQIAITFNQAPSNPGPIAVTTTAGSGTGTITIAGVGTITGLTIGGARNYSASTTSVAGNTLTIVVNGGSGVTSHSTNASGTGTFTGTSSFTSSGGQNLCSDAACAVSTSGSF
jgi:hypothetical protein